MLASLRNGAGIRASCAAAGIHHSTYHDWLEKYPAFAEAAEKARLGAVAVVEDALLKAATGYEVTETRQFKDDAGNARVEVIKREVAPQVGAICFFLKNRAPDRWRDKQEIDMTNSGNVTILIEGEQ